VSVEIHRQKCQLCGSIALKNILVRNEKNELVYVQCQNCTKPVARYVLAARGYFHFGRGFESFLRAMTRYSGLSSGRDLNKEFKNIEVTALKDFEKTLDDLEKSGKDS